MFLFNFKLLLVNKNSNLIGINNLIQEKMGNEAFKQQGTNRNCQPLNMQKCFDEKEHISNSAAYGEGTLYQLKKISANTKDKQQKLSSQLSNFSQNKIYFLKECSVPTNRQQTYKQFARLYQNLQIQIPTVVRLSQSWFKQQKSGCYNFIKASFVFEYFHQNLLEQIKTRKRQNKLYSEFQIASIADCMLSGLMLLERTGISLKSFSITDILFDSESQVYTIGIIRSLFQTDFQKVTFSCRENFSEIQSNQKSCIVCLADILQSCLHLSITQHYGQLTQKFKNRYSGELLQMIVKCKKGDIEKYIDLFEVLAPIQKAASSSETKEHQSLDNIQLNANCLSQRVDTVYNKARRIIKDIKKRSTEKDPVRKKSMDKYPLKSNKSSTYNSANRRIGANQTKKQGLTFKNTTQRAYSSNKNKLLDRFKHSNSKQIHKNVQRYTQNKDINEENSKKYVPIDQYCQNIKRQRDMELMKQFYPQKAGLSNRINRNYQGNTRIQQINYRCSPFDNQL